VVARASARATTPTPDPLRTMFPTTHRSVVAALGSTSAPERERARSLLVETYWKPVYKHLRLRWRVGPDDAEDLTQGFFAFALEKEFLAEYDAARARFRTYLRVCLDRWASNVVAAARREKRGGGARPLSLDFARAESDLRASPEPAAASLDETFDREWLRCVMDVALARLRAACERAGRPQRFAAFERYYVADAAPGARPTHADLARELGLSAGDVNNELAAARREFRRALLEALQSLTSSDDELRAEARFVLGSDAP